MTNTSTNYQVLARRYRPTKFSELMGQDVLVQTLTNAINSGRIAHAFIFTGVRGVGKTTTARLLARALNCTGHGDQPTADPCGKCPQCVAIGEDRHVDVMEVDAASRTGVDDVRELMDGVHYQPAFGRYKVYIIDEVHMLSKSAFNALLKTLEEPPAHVKFVFATTEIRKVPITVLSRCQRFDLQRIPVETLMPYFSGILEKEGVQFEEEALRLICKAADGSARDGKSLLEQAIVGASSGTITETLVKDMLGLGDRTEIVTLLEHLLKGEVTKALEGTRQMIKCGASAQQVLQDLMEVVHALSMVKVTNSKEMGDLAIPSASLQKCQEMVAGLSVPVLTRTWQILLKGMSEVSQGPLPECALEMVLIRVTHVKAFLSEGGVETAPTQAKESTPTAQPVMAQATPVKPVPLQDFAQLVKVFESHKEVILADQLKALAAVQEFRQGYVSLHVPAGTETQFLREASKLLKEWRGETWHFEISPTPGGTVLADVERNEKEQKMQETKAHPSVQKILETFPEAVVETH